MDRLSMWVPEQLPLPDAIVVRSEVRLLNARPRPSCVVATLAEFIPVIEHRLCPIFRGQVVNLGYSWFGIIVAF